MDREKERVGGTGRGNRGGVRETWIERKKGWGDRKRE